MNYTRLSVADVTAALSDVAIDAQAAFGRFDRQQLNWRPEPTRWSVAQCLDHLLTANRLMLDAAQDALRNPPRSVWQRLPLVPSLFGWVMIRSQAPTTRQRFTAPARARPSTSEIPEDIVRRFVDQHRAAAESTRALEDVRASRVIMISPFVRVVVYSVLDGLRLVVAHDHRHLAQARRVMLSPHFGLV
jgi:hypothetical protein